MPENKSRAISIYISQVYLDALGKLAANRMIAGRKPSISQLITEAVDAFIKASKTTKAPNDSPASH